MAGVSLKTVTNVVHERPYVRQETRDRVLAAIAQLDYRPSLAGRQLQSGRSHIITLAVPRIDEPYLGGLAHALIAAATPRGYTVLIDETGGHAEQEQQALSGYPGHGIDGVIYSPFGLDPEHLAGSRDVPLVLLGQYFPESTADYVAIDDVASARDAVRHLVQTGRRTIAFAGAQPDRDGAVGERRLAGYRAELAAQGLAEPPGGVVEGRRFARHEGEAAVVQLLASTAGLDALVCTSDLMAIGALRALRERQVRVPDDVAVLGWDDIVDGAYVSPSLTTVAPDLPVLAATTLDALIRRIDGDRTPGRKHVIPHRLVIRESTGTR